MQAPRKVSKEKFGKTDIPGTPGIFYGMAGHPAGGLVVALEYY